MCSDFSVVYAAYGCPLRAAYLIILLEWPHSSETATVRMLKYHHSRAELSNLTQYDPFDPYLTQLMETDLAERIDLVSH